MQRATSEPIQPDMADEPPASSSAFTFEVVYEKHFPFVWRTMRYLGVPEDCLDDAVQETFLVVHRRLGEFEGRASITTWLFSIVQNIARYYRRTLSRRARHVTSIGAGELDGVVSAPGGPLASAEARQAADLVSELLEQIDEAKRAVFALVELEQLSVSEAAEMLGINANTAASRLRAARKELQQAIRRYKVQQKWKDT